jgi:hypothetical protein
MASPRQWIWEGRQLSIHRNAFRGQLPPEGHVYFARAFSNARIINAMRARCIISNSSVERRVALVRSRPLSIMSVSPQLAREMLGAELFCCMVTW